MTYLPGFSLPALRVLPSLTVNAMTYFGRLLTFLIVAAWTFSAAAQPVIVPDLPILNLDELGVYQIGYAYRGKAEQLFPLGWSGFFEDNTGVACEPFGAQNGKSAFLLHSPWRNGTGITFQQFVFNLPLGRPTFSCAAERPCTLDT